MGSTLGGRFVLEVLVGEGGMGTVWRARDLQADRPVAVKRMRTASAEAWRCFGREIEVLRSLLHPALVAYVAHGTDEGEPWLAMEWLGDSAEGATSETSRAMRSMASTTGAGASCTTRVARPAASGRN